MHEEDIKSSDEKDKGSKEKEGKPHKHHHKKHTKRRYSDADTQYSPTTAFSDTELRVMGAIYQIHRHFSMYS
jgi:hypothetical protein